MENKDGKHCNTYMASGHPVGTLQDAKGVQNQQNAGSRISTLFHAIKSSRITQNVLGSCRSPIETTSLCNFFFWPVLLEISSWQDKQDNVLSLSCQHCSAKISVLRARIPMSPSASESLSLVSSSKICTRAKNNFSKVRNSISKLTGQWQDKWEICPVNMILSKLVDSEGAHHIFCSSVQ